MPCGGLYPVTPVTHRNARCWQCGLSAAAKPLDHFCDEWDTFIHRDCIRAFLMSDEGKIVLDHGHEVWISGLDSEAPQLKTYIIGNVEVRNALGPMVTITKDKT